MGRLLARTVIGGLLVGHGTQKLLGWFDGPGLDGTEKMMESLDLKPARRNALVASISETAGGGLLALGALTPVAGALITGSMATAIRTVHLPKGLWNANGGYEFNLTLIAATAAIVDAGPGPGSVDRALGIEARGTKWALAALAVGVAGSALTLRAAQQESEPETAPGEQVPSERMPEPAAA